jgi:Tfp pilus assembly protein PilO
MKKLLVISLVIALLGFFGSGSSLADEHDKGKEAQEQKKQELKEVKEQKKEVLDEFKEQKKEGKEEAKEEYDHEDHDHPQ